MILANEKPSKKPTGFKVRPTSYAKLEQAAEVLRKALPTVDGSHGMRLDCSTLLEVTLPRGGYNFHVQETADLPEIAGFTMPNQRLIVLRQDVYDGLKNDGVFSRSTVVHETSHIALDHAATFQRGPVGEHRFCEDSEWQAKAFTSMLMMPLEACKELGNAYELAQLCGTSVEAATYRLDNLRQRGLIEAGPAAPTLFG